MKLRYYQGRIDITKHCNLFFHGPPYPIRVTQRVLFTPDVGVHYCSAQRLTNLHHLDYQAEFEPNIEVPDDVVELWDAELNNGEHEDPGPIPHSLVCASYHKVDPVVLRTDFIVEHAYQGEYEDGDGENAFEEAREDAHANHLV